MSSDQPQSAACAADEYTRCLRNAGQLQTDVTRPRVCTLGHQLRGEFKSLQELLAYHDQAVAAADCPPDLAMRYFAWLSAGFSSAEPCDGPSPNTIDRYRILCEAAPIPMFIQDPEGCCLVSNTPLLKMLGASLEEIVGQRWVEMLASEDREAILDEFNRARDARTHFRADFRISTRAHPELWIAVQSAPIFDEFGQEIVRIGVVENVEERKRADLALRQSEEKFRILTETVPAAIFIFRGAAMLYANPFMEAITGYSGAELKSMPVWDVIHPNMREVARERGLGRQRGKERIPDRYEIKLLTKDGLIRWVDYTAQVIDYSGAPAVLGIAIDIGDRVRAEQEAQRLHADLIHLSRVSTLGKLSSELAHELNQPLAAIVNYANGCRRRAASAEGEPNPLLPAIDEIQTEAERAAQIVKRIRNFARKRPMQPTIAAINDLISEATRLSLSSTATTDSRMRFDLAEELPPVRVDRVQIIQVLVNLMTNALDAMSDLEPNEQVLNITSELDQDGAVRISVQDVGRGFTEEDAKLMFEPFFTTKREGLGLGLSISRSIAEAHGGRLWAEICPERGAAFRLMLPTSQEEPSQEEL